jgi:biotin-(acetyl-CoA carboxylase) ligase
MDSVRVGKVLDLDKDGFLILQDRRGMIERIISGDVNLLNQE